MVEYMGFMYISAALKQEGHTVDVFFDDQRNEDGFLAELKEFGPDIVGFSILTPTLPWAIRISKRIKDEIGAITICGNVHTIMNPEIIENEGFDILCIGEGENPMTTLAARVDAGEPYSDIPSLWVKTEEGIVKNDVPDLPLDLDKMPFHDRAMYNKYSFFRHSHYLRVLNGRMCPFKCTFCMNKNIVDHLGGMKFVRKRDPERAIAEIEYQIEQRRKAGIKVKQIFFVDEVFWLKNDWLREFLTLYKERIGIPFAANFRFGKITEEDIALIKEAGVRTLTVAAETGDETQRRTMMDKNVKDEQIFQVTGWLHKHRIKFGSSCFFGLPGDTVEDHVKRLGFYRRVNPTYVWTTFFEPYPKLPLVQTPEVQQYLPKEQKFSLTFHHDMFLELPDRDRLVNLKKVYFYCVKFPFISPFLIWLTKFRAPTLFNLIFMTHYAWHIFIFEGINVRQLMTHIKVMVVNPFLGRRRMQPRA